MEPTATNEDRAAALALALFSEVAAIGDDDGRREFLDGLINAINEMIPKTIEANQTSSATAPLSSLRVE